MSTQISPISRRDDIIERLQELEDLGQTAIRVTKTLLRTAKEIIKASKAREEAMIRSGDAMQSAASRLSEYIQDQWGDASGSNIPYEVRMAALEAESAINDWTEARTIDA